MTAMQQIEQLAIEARAHGMTYGEYVEKMKPKLPKPDERSKDGWSNRIAKSKEYKRRKEIKVVCEICGKKFTARNTLAKYCPDCKEDLNRERNRERKRKKSEEIRKQKNNS